MASLLFDILKTARPRQWIKNLTLFAALLLNGHFYTPEVRIRDFVVVSEAIAAFTLVAIAVYFLNDLRDIKADKAHPFKKNRPIAAGRIPVALAWVLCGVFACVGLGWAYYLSPVTSEGLRLFFLVVAGYFVMQILYSLWLKNVEVVDVYLIAIGFFLRVVAGAIVIDSHLSIWFLLCVISTSLFLAVGKRRAELAILSEQNAAIAHRKVMGKYSVNILDSYLSIFATAAFFSWALYTFYYEQADSTSTVAASLSLTSKTLTASKWLMATIPVVVFGIMRYIRIIYDGARAETPERVFLSDKTLLFTVALWGGIVVWVLYGGVR